MTAAALGVLLGTNNQFEISVDGSPTLRST